MNSSAFKANVHLNIILFSSPFSSVSLSWTQIFFWLLENGAVSCYGSAFLQICRYCKLFRSRQKRMGLLTHSHGLRYASCWWSSKPSSWLSPQSPGTSFFSSTECTSVSYTLCSLEASGDPPERYSARVPDAGRATPAGMCVGRQSSARADSRLPSPGNVFGRLHSPLG